MTETYTYDNLLVGDDYITDSATLVSGQNLKRGAALGKITASGKLAQLDSTKSDGTQTAYAILAADCDASGGDKVCPVYKSGEFNQAAVGFTGSDTAASFKEAFRAVDLYLKATIPA
jgi:hypothetical protein